MSVRTAFLSRRGRFLAVAALVIAAASVTVAVTVGGKPDASRGVVTAAAAIPKPTLTAPTGDIGVRQLERYRWTTLPHAPIAARTASAYAWTGSQLVIWGGSARTAYADGASYDPAGRVWRELPRAPLSPRARAAFAWTGSQLFVWGGNASATDASPRNDGALYDPATRRWRMLPPVDIRPTTTAAAVWTGNRVVLFTLTPAVHPNTVEVHAYDPRTDRWTTAPSIRVPQTEIMRIAPLAAGGQLWFWASVQTLAGNLTTGHDAYRYDPATNRWRTSRLLPTDTTFDIHDPIWTGDAIFFAPGDLACTCGGPAVQNTYGTWADPRTVARTRMPSWSQFDTDAGYVWTGAAVLAAKGAAAWNPATNRWARLAPPPRPLQSDPYAVTVWAGDRLLRWDGAGLQFGA